MSIKPLFPSALSLKVAEMPVQIRHAHVLTPETSQTTHYFYSSAHPRSLGKKAESWVDQELTGTGKIFREEDGPMLATQQKAFGEADFWQSRPLILKADATAIRVRRIISKMIKKEQAMSAD